jgi:hypothetical protein
VAVPEDADAVLGSAVGAFGGRRDLGLRGVQDDVGGELVACAAGGLAVDEDAVAEWRLATDLDAKATVGGLPVAVVEDGAVERVCDADHGLLLRHFSCSFSSSSSSSIVVDLWRLESRTRTTTRTIEEKRRRAERQTDVAAGS